MSAGIKTETKITAKLLTIHILWQTKDR